MASAIAAQSVSCWCPRGGRWLQWHWPGARNGDLHQRRLIGMLLGLATTAISGMHGGELGRASHIRGQVKRWLWGGWPGREDAGKAALLVVPVIEGAGVRLALAAAAEWIALELGLAMLSSAGPLVLPVADPGRGHSSACTQPGHLALAAHCWCWALASGLAGGANVDPCPSRSPLALVLCRLPGSGPGSSVLLEAGSFSSIQPWAVPNLAVPAWPGWRCRWLRAAHRRRLVSPTAASPALARCGHPCGCGSSTKPGQWNRWQRPAESQPCRSSPPMAPWPLRPLVAGASSGSRRG